MVFACSKGCAAVFVRASDCRLHEQKCVQLDELVWGLVCPQCSLAKRFPKNSEPDNGQSRKAKKALKRHITRVHKVKADGLEEAFLKTFQAYCTQYGVERTAATAQTRLVYAVLHTANRETLTHSSLQSVTQEMEDANRSAGESEVGMRVLCGTATGEAIVKLRWFESEADMQDAFSRQVGDVTDCARAAVKSWLNIARYSINQVLKTRADVLRLPIQGKSTIEYTDDIFKYRLLPALEKSTISNALQTFTQVVEFYALHALNKSFETFAEEYRANNPTGDESDAHAVQALIVRNGLEDCPDGRTKRFRAIEFLRSHALHKDSCGRLGLNSLYKLAKLSSYQLWMLRATAVTELYKKSQAFQLVADRGFDLLALNGSRLSGPLYMTQSILCASKPCGDDHAEWLLIVRTDTSLDTGNDSGRYFLQHRASGVPVLPSVFGVLYYRCVHRARDILAKLFPEMDGALGIHLDGGQVENVIQGYLYCKARSRGIKRVTASEVAQKVCGASREIRNELSICSLLALQAACMPLRSSSSQQGIVLSSRHQGHSLKNLGENVVSVVEVVVKNRHKAFGVPLVERLPTTAVSDLFVILHWTADFFLRHCEKEHLEFITPLNFASATQVSKDVDVSEQASDMMGRKAQEKTLFALTGVPMTVGEFRKLASHVLKREPAAFADVLGLDTMALHSEAQKALALKLGHTVSTDEVWYNLALNVDECLWFERDTRNAWLTLVGIEDERLPLELQNMCFAEVVRAVPDLGTPHKALQSVFGIDAAFQTEGQEQLLRSVWEGHDTAAQLRCGAGKSASFLCAGRLAERVGRIVLVLTPMRAASDAAIAQARSCGIECFDIEDLRAGSAAHRGGIVVLSFDQVQTGRNVLSVLEKIVARVILAVVDEAHIVCEHTSFRASMQAGLLGMRLAGIQRVYLSATLTMDVADYVAKVLWSPEPQFVTDSEVLPPISKLSVSPLNDESRLALHVRVEKASVEGTRVLIVVPTKKLVEDEYLRLVDNFPQLGDRIGMITADTESVARERAKLCTVIVGTSTVGLALNLENTCVVAVLYATFSIAQLVQAWGRTGRRTSLSHTPECFFWFDPNVASALQRSTIAQDVHRPACLTHPMYSMQAVEKFYDECRSRPNAVIREQLVKLCIERADRYSSLVSSESSLPNVSNSENVQMTPVRKVHTATRDEQLTASISNSERPFMTLLQADLSSVHGLNGSREDATEGVRSLKRARVHAPEGVRSVSLAVVCATSKGWQRIWSTAVERCPFCGLAACSGSCYRPVTCMQCGKIGNMHKHTAHAYIRLHIPPRAPSSGLFCVACLAPNHWTAGVFIDKELHASLTRAQSSTGIQRPGLLKARIEHLYLAHRHRQYPHLALDAYFKWLVEVDTAGITNAMKALAQMDSVLS
ncbi:hypothetical protein FVE85_8216 [Porphyridium purpureum]|uniref:DNA 3'-5' helicase n=1 Tax=Porphyridium purpureum TaxID=35688 RepID=A0A5J4YFG4_PORPP|nr:hypothetical protein FVE85_8954 [Porphyridium purpureum]KAA8490256.1 hypothetical protein FVE85_7684 [Porphyridium purpureum]KAA8491580.1 hypothetical protein FVE85_2595 [Porphyridium purpureum]KAA8492709.1 hypothetical protein FVE85_8216 [Porphyridium purpureum]|eukprot:POR0915..scf214_43